MSKRKHGGSPDSPTTLAQQPPIFTSTPVHDRSSTFTAVFTPSTASPRRLQRHPPFETASHKILAWRKPSSQRSISGSFSGAQSMSTSALESADETALLSVSRVVFETGSDEDGEKYAGKKVEKVLTDMDVQGIVVVARWYGGVMLGPVRFKWIEDTAREAILKWKESVGEARDEAMTKKIKIDGYHANIGHSVNETKEKDRLMRLLKERDASVGVLRGLLTEKHTELKRLEAGEMNEESVDIQKDDSTKSPAAALPDYGSMPLQRLKQLEKARDATLSWILKQIDLAEEKVKIAQAAQAEPG